MRSVSTHEFCILELIHSNFYGSMCVPFIVGSRYILTFIAGYLRNVRYFLKFKSEMSRSFIGFKAMVGNPSGRSIKVSRIDNGVEYSNKYF